MMGMPWRWTAGSMGSQAAPRVSGRLGDSSGMGETPALSGGLRPLGLI
jgi:hypothetical protein